MMISASVAVLLTAVLLLLSTTVNQQHGGVSAECVECQLLLSQRAAEQPPAGTVNTREA